MSLNIPTVNALRQPTKEEKEKLVNVVTDNTINDLLQNRQSYDSNLLTKEEEILGTEALVKDFQTNFNFKIPQGRYLRYDSDNVKDFILECEKVLEGNREAFLKYFGDYKIPNNKWVWRWIGQLYNRAYSEGDLELMETVINVLQSSNTTVTASLTFATRPYGDKLTLATFTLKEKELKSKSSKENYIHNKKMWNATLKYLQKRSK